jgi:hypothetical protein
MIASISACSSDKTVRQKETRLAKAIEKANVNIIEDNDEQEVPAKKPVIKRSGAVLAGKIKVYQNGNDITEQCSAILIPHISGTGIGLGGDGVIVHQNLVSSDYIKPLANMFDYNSGINKVVCDGYALNVPKMFFTAEDKPINYFGTLTINWTNTSGKSHKDMVQSQQYASGSHLMKGLADGYVMGLAKNAITQALDQDSSSARYNSFMRKQRFSYNVSMSRDDDILDVVEDKFGNRPIVLKHLTKAPSSALQNLKLALKQ